MKVLVTGGAGFIGSTVVDEFVRLGHRVWVIDNESSGKRSQVNKKAHYTKMDIRDTNGVARLFKKNNFDVVSHLAAQMDVRKSVLDPVFDAHVNVLGTLNLLNSARDTRVKKFLFSSS